MPRLKLIYSTAAVDDLQRLRGFLRPKNPVAAKQAGEKIVKSVKILEDYPHIGRPVDDMPDEYRDFIIEFGDSGYVVRYRIDSNSITLLAIRHQKEVGYLSISEHTSKQSLD
jgi:plasmid stabilization system protein ParE